MCDVTERELYEAVNFVKPSLIRTEADEFTYIFHIMIRYEIEKMIVAGEVEIDELPKIWNDKYEEYLGIRPSDDASGVLQDVHWTSGFGYFPTYALGNMYNSMYAARMRKEIDVDEAVAAGCRKMCGRRRIALHRQIGSGISRGANSLRMISWTIWKRSIRTCMSSDIRKISCTVRDRILKIILQCMTHGAA